jgi:hypothetical protein
MNEERLNFNLLAYSSDSAKALQIVFVATSLEQWMPL